jgi:hypothetical protein
LAELFRVGGKMKIYTYRDPFNLKSEEFWKEISQYPNLCVSQTLVLGLTQNPKRNYVRSDYNYIYTIDKLIDQLYGSWTDDPPNDIKQFISYSNEINQIEDPNIRNTFQFNRSSVVQSIRMLIELGISPEEIPNLEQDSMNIFRTIYSNLSKEDCWNVLNKIKVDKSVLKKAFEDLLEEEIDELKKNNPQDKNLQDLCKIKEDPESIKMDKIVIHGVHKFTPMITRFINDLRSAGVEIIFIINYIDEFERIYETWREVYRWTGLEIPKSSRTGISKNNLGEAIACLLEGEIKNYYKEHIEFIKFDNISSFCDYISEVYSEVDTSKLRKNDKRSRIFNMRQQFYIVNTEEVNNILKQYHPEQFGNRHFLAYPIGQFILSLYNMWDDKLATLKIDGNHLKECLSIGFFQQPNRPNPLEIYRKIEFYYEHLSIEDNYTIDKLLDKLKILKDNIHELDKRESVKKSSSLIRRFAMYTLTIEEVDYFIDVINLILKTSKKLFGDGHNKVNFKEHYSKLIEILTEGDFDPSYLIEEEKKMIEDIKYRISLIEDEDIEFEGSIEDLKESLHFYLARVESKEERKDQSSWIARNFEQLDGGVLLKDATRTGRAYHIGLVGDLDMNITTRDLLPWPLTEEFFTKNRFGNKNYIATITSFKEYRNFIRYSLFYATYFLDKKIIISYVENRKEEKNKPYYILDILGLDAERYDDRKSKIFRKRLRPRVENKISLPISLQSTKDEARNFLFCRYKYLIEEVIQGGTYFESEYHQNLYYKTMLFLNSWEKLQGKDISLVEDVVKKTNLELKKYFDSWSEINFIDAENKAIDEIKKRQIQRDQYGDYRVRVMKDRNDDYIETRRKFIYAKIDQKGEKTQEKGRQNLIREVMYLPYEHDIQNEIYNFINYNEGIEKNQEIEKCEYCAQNNLCLYGFRENE